MTEWPSLFIAITEIRFIAFEPGIRMNMVVCPKERIIIAATKKKYSQTEKSRERERERETGR